MPVQHSVWSVGPQPKPLAEASLSSEALLEDMIVAAPAMLSREWMLIGRQEETGFGGRIDLLAIAPDGGLVLIELKRGRTPREVVAQAIDYATWAERLEAEDLVRIYARFSAGGSLEEDFARRFGQPLDQASLNQSHQIVIVASTLDPSSERIVGYLNRRDIPINVLCFQVFQGPDGGHLLSRAWLLDPVQTQVAASIGDGAAIREPWNGEYYASFGHGVGRDWEEARRFGFISAGGGSWYSNTLELLKPGDLVWVKVPGRGFVGVGRVRGSPVPANEFRLVDSDGIERPAMDVLKAADYHRDLADDPDRREVFVPIAWAETRGLADAVNEVGLFGNQNTVCAPKTPKWRHTVERLKERFPGWSQLS